MVSVALALRLRAAGLGWRPAPGDRFVVRQPEMTVEQPFVLSDMTVQVHEFPTGRVIGFNGTTEWALDSVDQHETLWLPTEDQLRDLLGPDFQRLERTDDGYRVTAAGLEFVAGDAADAYAEALLHLLATGRAVPAGR